MTNLKTISSFKMYMSGHACICTHKLILKKCYSIYITYFGWYLIIYVDSRVAFHFSLKKKKDSLFYSLTLMMFPNWVMKHLQINNQTQRAPTTPQFHPELYMLSSISYFKVHFKGWWSPN